MINVDKITNTSYKNICYISAAATEYSQSINQSNNQSINQSINQSKLKYITYVKK